MLYVCLMSSEKNFLICIQHTQLSIKVPGQSAKVDRRGCQFELFCQFNVCVSRAVCCSRNSMAPPLLQQLNSSSPLLSFHRAMCSPSQGPCCTASCTLKYGDKCRDDNGCRDPSYCDGRMPQCPPSVNKPNKTICNEEFVCYMGVSIDIRSENAIALSCVCEHHTFH